LAFVIDKMGDHYEQKAMEVEMVRFEKEISFLASAPTTSFIPAQVRRSNPVLPPAPGTVPITAPTVVRPSPIVIRYVSLRY